MTTETRRGPQILRSARAAAEVGFVQRGTELPQHSIALNAKLEGIVRGARSLDKITKPISDEISKLRDNGRRVGLVLGSEMAGRGVQEGWITLTRITGDITYRYPEYPIVSPVFMTHEFAGKQPEAKVKAFWAEAVRSGITTVFLTPEWHQSGLAKYVYEVALEGRGSARVKIEDLNHDPGLRKMVAEARRLSA